jgi:hypothetical protein
MHTELVFQVPTNGYADPGLVEAWRIQETLFSWQTATQKSFISDKGLR